MVRCGAGNGFSVVGKAASLVRIPLTSQRSVGVVGVFSSSAVSRKFESAIKGQAGCRKKKVIAQRKDLAELQIGWNDECSL